MIVDEGNVRGGDDPSGEPTAVKGVYGEDGRGNAGTFDVNVTGRRLFVDEDVQDAAVFVALFDDVVFDFNVPVRVGFRGRIEHVGQQETLGSDWR